MNQPTDLEKALIDRKLLELSTIFDNASVGIVFMRGHIIQRCNKRMAEMYGCDSPKELVGQSSVVLYPDEQSYERLGREAAPLLAAGRSFEVDWEFRKRDGSAVWSRLYGKALDPIDPGQGSVWIVEDISEAKRAQEALKQSLGALEALMSNAPVGIGITRDRRIVRYNRKFGEMYGFPGDSGVGQPGRALYRSDEEYAALGKIAGPLLSQSKPFQTELYMRHQDGSDLWVNLIGYVQNPENPAEGTIWIGEDRTAA
jgi:PAS domain S-box-containing protein